MVKKVNNQNLILKKITQQALLNEMRNCAKVSEIKRTMFSNQLIIIVYKKEFLSTNDLNPTFPSSIMFLLQDYEDDFPKETPHGLPPIRGIEHPIDFVPDAYIPN